MNAPSNPPVFIDTILTQMSQLTVGLSDFMRSNAWRVARGGYFLWTRHSLLATRNLKPHEVPKSLNCWQKRQTDYCWVAR